MVSAVVPEAKGAADIETVRDLRKSLEEKIDTWFNDPLFFGSTIERQNFIWKRLVGEFPLLDHLRAAIVDVKKAGAQAKLDSQLIEKVIGKAFEIKKLDHAENDKLFAAVEALRALERFLAPAAFDRECQKCAQEEPKKENNKKQNAAEEKGKSKPPPPEFPELGKNYEAKNKNTEGDGESQERVRIASVNVPKLRYFRARVYPLIDARRNRWLSLDITEPFHGLPPNETHSHILKVRPLNKKNEWLSLPLPEGYAPITFSKGGTDVKKRS
jgi:hypothetical protein